MDRINLSSIDGVVQRESYWQWKKDKLFIDNDIILVTCGCLGVANRPKRMHGRQDVNVISYSSLTTVSENSSLKKIIWILPKLKKRLKCNAAKTHAWAICARRSSRRFWHKSALWGCISRFFLSLFYDEKPEFDESTSKYEWPSKTVASGHQRWFEKQTSFKGSKESLIRQQEIHYRIKNVKWNIGSDYYQFFSSYF